MKKVKLEIEMEYDDEVMHGDDEEGIEWFKKSILTGDKGLLLLHSNLIGDHLGDVKVIKIIEGI